MRTKISPFEDRAVQVLGWVRVGVGVAALVAPSAPARPWVGADAGRSPVRTLARALGARDVALGVGTLLAQRNGQPRRGWLGGSALADAGDVVTTLIGWRSRPRVGRLLVLAAASGGALTCGVLAARSPTS